MAECPSLLRCPASQVAGRVNSIKAMALRTTQWCKSQLTSQSDEYKRGASLVATQGIGTKDQKVANMQVKRPTTQIIRSQNAMN